MTLAGQRATLTLTLVEDLCGFDLIPDEGVEERVQQEEGGWGGEGVVAGGRL